MSLRPYKFIVQAVVQELDEDGNVTGEVGVGNDGQPNVIYGCDALVKWAAEFTANLAAAESEQPTG